MKPSITPLIPPFLRENFGCKYALYQWLTICELFLPKTEAAGDPPGNRRYQPRLGKECSFCNEGL